MSDIFLKILNMSIAASWLILAVVLLRFMLKKAPKWVAVLLWGIVALRLMVPFSFESVLSLIPSAETFNAYNIQYETPAISSGIPAINNAVNPILGEAFAPNPVGSVNPLYVWTFIVSVVWLTGIAAMLLYAVISYARVRRSVAERVPYKGNIFLCDHVKSPFILGLVRPKIYLPSNMGTTSMEPVIAHERAHLARRDHWWKPMGFLILAVHWFNPLCWVAYVLLCRDIELACDEKVIRQMDLDGKKHYSTALLECSSGRRLVSICPLAFGEVGVKERVRKVLNYKKPAFWVIIVAIVACAAAAVCFLTDPKPSAEVRQGDNQIEGGSASPEERPARLPETSPSKADQSETWQTELLNDIAYHLELSALGKEFRDMEETVRGRIMSEYSSLLDSYLLLTRESADGSARYIVGVYAGNSADSPLSAMHSMEIHDGDGREYQMLYTEEEEAAVREKGAGSGAGTVIDGSRIFVYGEDRVIFIQPETVEMSLANAIYRYFSLGREYIQDAVSRGIAVNTPKEPYLSVYLISEKYGEIVENIPLNARQAADIYRGEKKKLADGIGFGATLYLDGASYPCYRSGEVSPLALELAVKRCGYTFAVPGDIDAGIVEARLDCSWLDTPRYAEEENLARLREILVHARSMSVGNCGYDAKLTITLADGKQITIFKGTDSCDTMVFGSWGGYEIGEEENKEFWEIFGLDAEFHEPMEPDA